MAAVLVLRTEAAGAALQKSPPAVALVVRSASEKTGGGVKTLVEHHQGNAVA